MGFKVASRVRGLSDEAFREAFGTEEQCRAALLRLRWPDGFVCPCCGHRGHCVLAGRGLYQCNRCKKQTSPTAGTIFHATKLPLTLWFAAIHLIVTAKNGISSVELGRRLGVKQPTAWAVKHKIMAVMARREGETALTGRVEMDDAYLGGVRSGGKRGRGAAGKTPFVAAVSTSPEGRPRKLKLAPVKGFRKREIARGAKHWLAPGAAVVTDGLGCWSALDETTCSHQAIRTGSGRKAARVASFKWVKRLIPLIPAFLDVVFGVDRRLMFSYCSVMASRWKQDRPMSRAAFEARFPDEAACARHLAAMRWPDGFVCPACGHGRGWELKRRRASWECAACGKETSVSAGTIMHRSHLPLKTWFMAAHIVTSHSNGISALQLQAQLGLGSYKSAWLLLHKLRRAMVAPDRSLLEDLVEIDEATLPLRTKQEPPTGGQGRSPQGKMRIAGAVELTPEGEPRRIRLAPIGDFSARSLHAFVAGTSAPGARVITDGWSGYCGLPDHEPKVVGATPAHLVLACIHRVFSNLKRWALGTFHGLRRPHLRRYLDEFVFRWNRRRHTATAFDTLLGIGTRLQPAGYRDIVGQRA